MLETTLYCAYPNSFPSYSSNRCRRCGSGLVMGSDGFLMDYCMNCANWQNASDVLNLDCGRLKEAVVKAIQRSKSMALKIFSFKKGGAAEEIPARN